MKISEQFYLTLAKRTDYVIFSSKNSNQLISLTKLIVECVSRFIYLRILNAYQTCEKAKGIWVRLNIQKKFEYS